MSAPTHFPVPSSPIAASPVAHKPTAPKPIARKTIATNESMAPAATAAGSSGFTDDNAPPTRAAGSSGFTDDNAPPTRAELIRALRFLHLVDTQSQARLSELSATVHALIETLMGSGALPIEGYQQRRHLKILQENRDSGNYAGIHLTDVPDKYAVQEPDIDCAELLPLCRARCCHFSFALSVQDIDEGVVRWEYGQPYRIARNEDGSCTHLCGSQCQVYEQRPAVCRSYDCRNDKRVWLDFENRIPAPMP